MTKNKPQWHGVLLVAGGAVGAGMFALPMVSAGAWLLWSVVGFLLVWLMTYVSASLFAKINIALVNAPENALDENSNFSSLVEHVMGARWALFNNLSIVFIMMILMYAYTTAGASIVSVSLQSLGAQISSEYRSWLSLGFALLVATFVWLGVSWVSRITLWLMLAMAVTFTFASIGILPLVDVQSLVVPELLNPVNTLPYVFAALPVYITAFACAGLVPSLVFHYQTQTKKVTRSVFYGTLLALLVYAFWLIITLGSVGREGFITVIANGGNIGELVEALVNKGLDPQVETRLTLFSHLAIITSFLSVGVGLLHFMQDKLGLGDTASNRLVGTLVCFLPPAFFSFFMPYGFVHAIGFAGLFVAFSFFIVPGVMAIFIANTQNKKPRPVAVFVIAFGTVVLMLKCALLVSLLPSFA